MKHLLYFVLAVSLVGMLMVPIASSQEATVPNWIKNNAGWWASDQIPDSAFLQGIQYLIKEGIMVIPSTETSESLQSQVVPNWIKNNAGWWAEDKISEVEFVNAIQYLVKHGIIIVHDGSLCVNDLSGIFGDPILAVQHLCDSHESSVYTELIPFEHISNLNSHGFRGPEFSEIKPPNTYRIFMVGGSTMFGSGESSDETTIPGILQKLFDSNSSAQKIEVINAGMTGANSNSELNLINEKFSIIKDPNLLRHDHVTEQKVLSPDLVVVYDGWNDLRTDYPVDYTREAWELMCQLSKHNNFEIIITHQPIAGFGDKKLTQQEMVNSLTGKDHRGYHLNADKPIYDYMGRELLSLQDNCNVVDLRGIFDDISGPIYWDEGHVSDAGNLILAEKFHEIINETIFNKKPTESKFHNTLSKYNSPPILSYLFSKIGIDVDYTQIKHNLSIKDKNDGNYFYLKNQFGASEKILVGQDLSNVDLSKIDLTGQNLSGANLSGQDLRKVDLTDTILLSANLSFTDLSGKDLSGKNLRGANFHGAILENADLSGIAISKPLQYLGNPECSDPSDTFANVLAQRRCIINVIQNESIRTDFSNANLKGAIISPAHDTKFYHVDFSNANLTGVEFSDLFFGGCKFNGVNLENSNISNTIFLFCEFEGDTKFNGSKFSNVAFQDVSFRNAKIIDAYFDDTLFIDIDFSNTDLKGSIINEAFMVGDITRTCQNHEICE